MFKHLWQEQSYRVVFDSFVICSRAIHNHIQLGDKIDFLVTSEGNQQYNHKTTGRVMYYDLSIPNVTLLDLTHLLNALNRNTYTAVAIDHQFSDVTITPPPESYEKVKSLTKGLTLYSRATLLIEQTSTLYQMNQVQNNGYDIMAVRPKSEKIFHALCVEYDNYDIISLDMSVKIPFMLKRNPVYEALRKGKFFQMQYSPMFDESTRVICMTNMINLIKATGGKNLILSSSAKSIYTQRTPYDSAALLASIGLNKNQALATMKQNPQNLIKASIHRKFFKSTITELPLPVVAKLSKRIKKHKQKLSQLAAKKKQVQMKE